jgi:hypothetical protein
MTSGPNPDIRGATAAAARRSAWPPVVVLVVAASAVVAFAATGIRLLLPPAGLSGAWVRLVQLAGAAMAAAGVAGLWAQRKRLAQNGRRAPDPTVAGLVAAATTMVLVTLLALVSPTGHLSRRSAGPADAGANAHVTVPDAAHKPPSPGAKKLLPSNPFGLGLILGRRIFGGPGAAGQNDAETPQQRMLRRAGRLMLLALLLAVVVMAVRSFLRRGAGDEGEEEAAMPEPEPPVAAEDAAAGLEASLDELASPGRDPRQQITAAYRRLLAALAEAGARRLPQEAPYEHLNRALRPLRVEPAPMHRLTELYVIAQFSEHPVTEAHRAAAAEALAVSLDGLRGTIDDRRSTIDVAFAGDA